MGFFARRWVVTGVVTVAAAAVAMTVGQIAASATGSDSARSQAPSAGSARAVGGAGAVGGVGAGRASIGTPAGATRSGPVPGSVYVPTTRTLYFGSHGPAVKALQLRLSYLHYYAGRADGNFGWDTLEGVWAFKEVQSGKIQPRNPNVVGPTMQRQLLHPRLPQVLHPRGGSWRVEINKRIEVLVLYRYDKVELITHVSSGGGYYYCSRGSCAYAITPDGHFHTWAFTDANVKVPLGYMYKPVYFLGTGYAIHGEPNGEVPLYPASHGCVRIPWDLANFFHKLVRIGTHGTPVYISG
jgi:peptidoglycan hydrolase-like protein with peptidoglycan-binding domain